MTDRTPQSEIADQLITQNGLTGAEAEQARALSAFLTDPSVAETKYGAPLPVAVLRRHRTALGLSDEDIEATQRARGLCE